ncbi:helix-turn-helix domain-containing protein [Macrococcus capreoli]|uniref:helix-turn-helix domain-containing protein n=1 Tax=Macrococcus capreoli TaxID=2982690 RepID=UPI003EE5D5B8
MKENNNIAQLRKAKGWTQERLAEEAKLSVRTIQRIEKGEESSLESMGLVANVLGVPISDLFNQNNVDNIIKDYSEEQIEQINERRAKKKLFLLVIILYNFFMLYVGAQLEHIKDEKYALIFSILWVVLFICGWILLMYIRESYWKKKLDKLYPLTKNIDINKKADKKPEYKYVEIASQICWRIVVPLLFILKYVLRII